MEYTVGSLAGLISGKSPEKKKKVVTKEFKIHSPIIKEAKVEDSQKGQKRKKSVVEHSVKEEKDVHTSSVTPKVKKNKKRKLESSIEQPDHLDSESEQANPVKQELSQNDLNAIKRVKRKKRQEKQESPQYNDRTIFVGNVPISIDKAKILKHFKKYGTIESVRIRGIPVKDIKTPKKVAAIKKEFHPDRNTVFAYIRFKNSESAKNAESENGALFEGHHLRVQSCEAKDNHDETKAIFIGNLPYSAEEEDVWKLFQDCGEISHIRIVRDGRTSIGKGFGYVNFKDSDSVQLALEMENVKLKDREVRISPCDIKRAKKKDGGKKPRHKRNKKPQDGDAATENKGKGGRQGENQNFGGTKFDEKKKKKKFSKDLAQKKKLAKKLAPKPAS